MQPHSEKPGKSEQILVANTSFTFQEISTLIEAFYRQVEHDKILKVSFRSVKEWPEHIDRLTHFWWVRLGGSSYMQTSYNPPLKHFEAGFNEDLLKRWLDLFEATLSAHLSPTQRDIWLSIAQRMGVALNSKNEYLKRQLGKT